MKTYKKVGDKIYSTESVEVEVDVKSIESRIKTLKQAIDYTADQLGKLETQTSTYEVEKSELESELTKIKKL